MCLAIPMRITAIDGLKARCEAFGVEREVSLLLLQHDLPAVGDYVTVQLGQAWLRVSEAEARLTWQLYDQMLSQLDDAAPTSPSAPDA
ncbi:MAG: HypC/HybG/HupF family hydrogenase formation chaperone [Thiobacillaceae bacterium]|nr:HypC/HybG/HupF family hydrogenase formation chaperone [Thiobacillaceae bacterium]MDW8323863.1 HypC/HybG/HupF family hydrogenase formation chaperone [Burkholderiales bacterium]